MRIINLIENTKGTSGCACAHGLSFYAETACHRLLCDLGPSEETLDNAKKLGIDLRLADTVVLSHGHYDHSGGILAFAQINPDAVIYMQRTALGEYYADEGEQEKERYRYIGIDRRIAELPQTRLLDGDHRIDDELELFTIGRRSHALPFANRNLKRKSGSALVSDSFVHEQFLVIKDGSRRFLLSGCAHNGILNILDEYRLRYGQDPDVLISGFHLMKKTEYSEEELSEIEEIAKELKRTHTRFYTCHCTGAAAFEAMKRILGDQLLYVHSGDAVWE